MRVCCGGVRGNKFRADPEINRCLIRGGCWGESSPIAADLCDAAAALSFSGKYHRPSTLIEREEEEEEGRG